MKDSLRKKSSSDAEVFAAPPSKEIRMNYCGANCIECMLKDACKGCKTTCGSPFGGECVAAECIKKNGKEKYAELKQTLISEINALGVKGMPELSVLYELAGNYVNLTYPLPSGDCAAFLNGKNVYLGAQLECESRDRCFGVIADEKFILVCEYGENASDPELVLYKRR